MNLALDYNNDLTAGDSISRVTDGRRTIQTVRNKLRTVLGEWALDETKGWISVEDYEKGYDLFDLEIRARAIILGTMGVERITEFSMVVSKRVLTLYFKANTIYGEIDLSIPFSAGA